MGRIIKMPTLNVFMQPLRIHSTQHPITGFLRSGYCEVPWSDVGNHSVAATVTDSFLDFSASRGNDLRSAGITPGCKWCLCAARWREALLGYRSAVERGERPSEDMVPKVDLDATNLKALEVLAMEDLSRYAQPRAEVNGVNGVNGVLGVNGVNGEH